jgi:hypothetical protein
MRRGVHPVAVVGREAEPRQRRGDDMELGRSFGQQRHDFGEFGERARPTQSKTIGSASVVAAR